MRPRRILGVSLVALLGLAACQTAAGPPAARPIAKPPGSLQVVVPALPVSLDPALTPPSDSGVARTAYETLLKPRADLSDVQPAAAEAYEVSADGLVYTFHLRAAAGWSDGRQVRAQEFVNGWRRILDPRVNSPLGPLLAGRVKNAAAYVDLDPKKDAARIPGFLDGLGIKAVDDRTLVVQLDHRAPDFKWIVSVPACAPAREESAPSPTGPGNGPFHVEAAGKDQVVLAPNDHYWGGRPRLKQIVLLPAGEPATDLIRFRSGQVDLATTSGALAAEVVKDPALAGLLERQPSLELAWMQFNIHSPPFDLPGVRLAFAKAIDRDALVRQVLDGAGIPSLGPIPKGLRGYRPALAAQRFDAAQAKAVLDASGASSGTLSGIHLLVRDLPADRRLANFLASQLMDHLGVQVTVDVKSSPDVSKLLQRGEFQLQAPGGWIADRPEEQDFMDLFGTENFGQWSRYASVAYDHLLRAADAEADPTRRLQGYLQAQQLLAQDAPVGFLYQSQSMNLKQGWVGGAVYTPIDDWPGDVFASALTVSPHRP